MHTIGTNSTRNPDLSRAELTPRGTANDNTSEGSALRARGKSTTRMQGSVRTDRKWMGHDRMVKRIKEQQAGAGIVVVPRAEKNDATAGDVVSWLDRGANWVWQQVPAVNLFPMAEAAPAIAETGEKRSWEPLGQGGVLMSEFDFTKFQSPHERETEASTQDDVTRTLKRFVGKDKVHTIQNSRNATPYVRNVVAEGPNSMLTTGSQPQHYEAVRDGAENFFKKNNIKYQRVRGAVNFANVEFIPENDLLVLANGDRASLINREMKAQLTELFGNPKHVIHLELNAERLNSAGAPICYDLDLAFHAMTNAEGESIALIHKPCIKAITSTDALMGRQELLETLGKLGYKIIEISAEDQMNLAANSLSLDIAPGKILFPSNKISEKLKSQLEKHRVTPSFSMNDKVLGHPVVDRLLGYGIHCLTVSLRRPENSKMKDGL